MGIAFKGRRQLRLLDRRGRVHARAAAAAAAAPRAARRHDGQRGHDGRRGRGGTTGSAGTAPARQAAPARPAPAAPERADATADHQRRTERLGVALLGLLQARLRLDRQHRRQDADQELQKENQTLSSYDAQERVRERRHRLHVLERRAVAGGSEPVVRVRGGVGRRTIRAGAATSCSSPAAATTASNNSLNGKMMIVQVINNGGVGGDQFDLLIPGGGVGALNGSR